MAKTNAKVRGKNRQSDTEKRRGREVEKAAKVLISKIADICKDEKKKKTFVLIYYFVPSHSYNNSITKYAQARLTFTYATKLQRLLITMAEFFRFLICDNGKRPDIKSYSQTHSAHTQFRIERHLKYFIFSSLDEKRLITHAKSYHELRAFVSIE